MHRAERLALAASPYASATPTPQRAELRALKADARAAKARAEAAAAVARTGGGYEVVYDQARSPAKPTTAVECLRLLAQPSQLASSCTSRHAFRTHNDTHVTPLRSPPPLTAWPCPHTHHRIPSPRWGRHSRRPVLLPRPGRGALSRPCRPGSSRACMHRRWPASSSPRSWRSPQRTPQGPTRPPCETPWFLWSPTRSPRARQTRPSRRRLRQE